MDAHYKPDQQPGPPSEQGAYPPPQGAYPQYPQQQGDLPPSYDKPPPINGTTSHTVVVAAQPTTATTTYAPKTDGNEILATSALVFSIITILCCGTSVVCLACIIPALILAIKARGSTGSEQQKNAAISIALNAAVVICCVLFLVIFIPVVSVSSAASASASTNSYRNSYRYSYYG